MWGKVIVGRPENMAEDLFKTGNGEGFLNFTRVRIARETFPVPRVLSSSYFTVLSYLYLRTLFL